MRLTRRGRYALAIVKGLVALAAFASIVTIYLTLYTLS